MTQAQLMAVPLLPDACVACAVRNHPNELTGKEEDLTHCSDAEFFNAHLSTCGILPHCTLRNCKKECAGVILPIGPSQNK